MTELTDLVRCRSCGFVHLAKKPTDGTLAEFYRSRFWQHEKAGARERIESQREWWEATYGDWLTAAERFTDGRGLLDVGAGFGLFLEVAGSRGWNGVGIDPSLEVQTETGPSPVSAEPMPHLAAPSHATPYLTRPHLAPSSEILPRAWQDWEGEGYDLISAQWVIEHLRDPLTFLQWAANRLTDGGVLLLAFPNEWTAIQSRANRVARKRDWWIDPSHVSYFSTETICNLLGRAGFVVADMLATYPMERFILRGHDYTDNPTVGQRCHRAVERFDLKMIREDRMKFYRTLAEHGQGRDLVILAQRAGTCA